jgi:membrane protease subunit (stomatin/prohibitin family)
MFVCEECHSEPGHLSWSYGPCEGCGKINYCYNCGCRNPWRLKGEENAKQEKVN